ncbi:hypothetical protein MTO96_036963 [Rhipicephalus appendiculatus]
MKRALASAVPTSFDADGHCPNGRFLTPLALNEHRGVLKPYIVLLVLAPAEGSVEEGFLTQAKLGHLEVVEFLYDVQEETGLSAGSLNRILCKGLGGRRTGLEAGASEASLPPLRGSWPNDARYHDHEDQLARVQALVWGFLARRKYAKLHARPKLPQPRHQHAVTCLDDALYVAGGLGRRNSRRGLRLATSACFRYRFRTAHDQKAGKVAAPTGKWERLPDMRHARINHAAVALKGRVYAVAGQEEFDAWTVVGGFRKPHPPPGKRAVDMQGQLVGPTNRIRSCHGAFSERCLFVLNHAHHQTCSGCCGQQFN